MRLVDYIGLVRQRLALVGAVIGVVALISVGLSMNKPPIHESSVRLRTLPIAPDALGSSVSEVLQDSSLSFTTGGTEALMVQSHEVGEIVAARLALPVPPEQIIKQVTVQGIPETTVLVLTTQAADPILAIQLANTFAEAYLEVRRDDANEALDHAQARLTERLQEVQTRLTEASARAASLPPGSIAATDAAAQRDLALADLTLIRSQLRDITDREALGRGFGEVILPATEAKVVRDTSPTRSLVFGLMLGAPVALAAVLLLDSLSQTVRSKEDAEELAGAEVLGMIPSDSRVAGYGGRYGSSGKAPAGRSGKRGMMGKLRRNGHGAPALTVDADPFSPVSEAYRTASLNLAAAVEQAGYRSVLVTSPITGDGKTTTVSNVAVCHAERDMPVVLIDADLRRPAAHDLFEVEPDPGLAEIVRSGATARAAMQNVRPSLRFVGAGAPVERPDQLLSHARAASVLTKLGTATKGRAARNGRGEGAGAATLLIDSAPILQAAETLSLVRSVDGVVLVIRAGVTRKAAAARAVEQIRRSGADLLGVFLVGVSEGEEMGLSGSYGSAGKRRLAVVKNDKSEGKSAAKADRPAAARTRARAGAGR